MGPRQELIEEIKKEANVDFHMYSSERFLSYGQSLLKEKINQQALEEIQTMKKAELEELKRIKSHENRRFDIEIKAKDEMNYLSNKINAVNSKIFMLRQESEKIFKDSMRSDETSEYLHSIGIHDAELQEERAELISRLDSLKKLISENENVSNIDRFRSNKYFNEFGDEKR